MSIHGEKNHAKQIYSIKKSLQNLNSNAIIH